MVGETLLHYAIDARLGQGGMATVYRAHDTVLNRTVAIKILDAGDAEATRRLLHEARAASAFNHPNSVTVYAVEQHGDVAFIVMEHVQGATLDRVIPAGGLPVARALRYACDIADAIAAAHAQGIVHRDIKPANVMITPEDRVKVLDFGIAQRRALPDAATRPETLHQTLSAYGALVGTAGYMSPEQIKGQPATARSDVFALGAVIYHMLTGAAPFGGDSMWAVLESTVSHEPRAVTAIHREVPAALGQLVSRCLAKDPDSRYASAREVFDALIQLRQDRSTVAVDRRQPYRRAAIAAAVIVALASAAGFTWAWSRESRLRWARDTAIPEMSRLFAEGEPVAAYRLGVQARASVPNDPQVEAAWNRLTRDVPIVSDPPGAEVAFRALSGADEGWIPAGTTPTQVRIPMAPMRWKFALAGHDTLEVAPMGFPAGVTLVRTNTAPPGTVRVPNGTFNSEHRRLTVTIPAYWIDRFEVTNRQFKEFIDRGGYRDRAYWREPLVRRGTTLSWDEALALFRDTTGRLGPATWELGTFPDGQADWPVSGVSWYEAAAYAAWSGRVLPTVYHWFRASGAFGTRSDILQHSNFNGQGPAPIGVSGSLGPFGTHDMAGNVKEWTWNESSAGRRYILGGGWNEARHMFHDQDARDPFDRQSNFGFRCILPDAPGEPLLTSRIDTLTRDVSELKPASDEVYQAYRRLYDYDPRPLDSRVDERDDTLPNWIAERVSFAAAYGNERVPVMLFLPRNAVPPYQVAIFAPAADADRARSSRAAGLQFVEFLVRSGRAVAYPVYQQTYERIREGSGQNFLKQNFTQRGQDVRRTVDYLETRSDLDRSRIALYGLSIGAQLAPLYLAIEPRLRTGVLLSGGFETWILPPEVDPVHFTPRVTQPVLMVNGREDFDLPYETAQVPMFQMLGTPPEHKRHVVLDGGHLPPRPQAVFKEILDWLDRYLGPVAQ
jgi:formylglycine-generating enzyme required for sulfatase activity